jgi:hypothetical protein
MRTEVAVRYVSRLVDEIASDPETSWYVQTLLLVDGERKSSIDFLEAWAASTNPLPLLIIGGYGVGKTALCRQMVYRFGSRWLASPSQSVLPLLLSLSEADRRGGIAAAINEWLITNSRDYALFDTFRGKGRIKILPV